jgi:starch phosphorylase
MKSSIATGLGYFSSARMVGDYNRKYYQPAAAAFEHLTADNADAAAKLVNAKRRLVENFDGGRLSIANPVVQGSLTALHVGDSIAVTVEVELGGLIPEEVEVDAYSGSANAHNELVDSVVTPLAMLEDRGNGRYLYGGEIECGIAGRFGLTARIKAAGDAWDNSVPGFMCWPR